MFGTIPRALVWPGFRMTVFESWWFPADLRPLALRAFGATVDDGTVIRRGVRIERPWRVRITGPAWIGAGAQFVGDGEIVVERQVGIGAGAVLGARDGAASLVVRRGAWVGDDAVVSAGAEVGEHAVIGSGVTVTGRVAPGSVVDVSPS